MGHASAGAAMIEDPPVENTRTLLHFIDGSVAYAGHYLHEDSHPIHTHSFVRSRS